MHEIFTATSTTHDLRKVWRSGSDGPWQDEKDEGYRYAKHFTYESHSASSLEDVRDLLNLLADVPEASLVLGKPMIERGGRTGLDFEDVPTTLCLADLDSLEFDGTPEEAVVFALPFLRGREFVYAFSPSSGFKPGHRLRVAFEVEPMDLTMMQIHAENWNTDLAMRVGINRKFIDHSIYKPAGFVFTARPALKGLEDPHPVRAFLVEGTDGPVPIPKLPDMIEIEATPSVNLGQKPTLRWDSSGRHNSVLNFLVAYRTAFPNSVHTEAWEDLKAEYDRLDVPSLDRREFGETYIKNRYSGIRGSKRKRKAFPTVRDEVSLDGGSNALSEEIRDFVQAREPGVKVINGEVGIGKTRAMLHWLGVETRYAEHTNDVFLTDLYVPNHKLSAQIEDDARKHGMSAYTELGRTQELNGRPVCTKHDAISKVQGIVTETRKAFCENEDAQCSDRPGCLWWDMHSKALTHDLRIRAHAHLPLQVAKEHGRSRVPNFVVIDENFLGALIKNAFVEVKDLCDVTRHDMGEWMFHLSQVIKDGMTVERLEEAGFTPDICRELIKAENDLAPEVEVSPDMSASEALEAATGYDGAWYKYASFWRRLRDALEARSLNRLRVTPNKKALVLNWRQKIAGIPWDNETNRPHVPVLVLSATIKRSMIEAVLPVDDWVSIEVEKHEDAHVTQVPVNTSKSALLYGTGDREAEYDEKDAKRRAAAEQFRKDVVSVSEGRHLFSYKSLVDEDVPLAGWFNAVEGLNDWAGGEIDVVGRPLPAPRDVEDIARAIHQDGDPIVPVGEWYPKRPFAMFGGAGMSWCERHVDPRVEDVRWVICEGAMMQVVGRARHVRQACKIRLFTNLVLPIKVDEVRRFDELRPEELEYDFAPVRTSSPRLAQRLFRKFEGMSAPGIKGATGNLFDWAMNQEARFIEVRLQGEKQWSRVWLASGGWQWLCDRAPVVDWRDARKRADDHQQRFDALVDQSEFVDELWALREAFAREAWHDDEGVVPEGRVTTVGGWSIEMQDVLGTVREQDDGRI